MDEKLSHAIEKRRDDLIALTRDLIRFPTINPPGEAYTPCAEYIAERLQKIGFETQLIRGEGTPGDTERYPRTNVIARSTAAPMGRRCISILISMSWIPATVGPSILSKVSSRMAKSTGAVPAI